MHPYCVFSKGTHFNGLVFVLVSSAPTCNTAYVTYSDGWKGKKGGGWWGESGRGLSGWPVEVHVWIQRLRIKPLDYLGTPPQVWLLRKGLTSLLSSHAGCSSLSLSLSLMLPSFPSLPPRSCAHAAKLSGRTHAPFSTAETKTNPFEVTDNDSERTSFLSMSRFINGWKVKSIFNISY